MENQLRDKLESAALRLDEYLDAAHTLGPRETTLLAAARESPKPSRYSMALEG